MINETFRYFWRRTVPGGIWWEHKEDAGVQFAWLMVIPMAIIGLSIGHFEDTASLRPLYEAYSHASWYVAIPISIVAFALASAVLNVALLLVLKAMGFAIMVVRFRKFMERAETEWLLALTDPHCPTDLDREEWLLDRIDEMAETEWRLSIKSRPVCRF